MNNFKLSLKESIKAFRIGKECYQCDFYNEPIRCDLARDETCETSIISRFLFAVKIFFLEYKFNRKYFNKIFGDNNE